MGRAAGPPAWRRVVPSGPGVAHCSFAAQPLFPFDSACMAALRPSGLPPPFCVSPPCPVGAPRHASTPTPSPAPSSVNKGGGPALALACLSACMHCGVPLNCMGPLALEPPAPCAHTATALVQDLRPQRCPSARATHATAGAGANACRFACRACSLPCHCLVLELPGTLCVVLRTLQRPTARIQGKRHRRPPRWPEGGEGRRQADPALPALPRALRPAWDAAGFRGLRCCFVATAMCAPPPAAAREQGRHRGWRSSGRRDGGTGRGGRGWLACCTAWARALCLRAARGHGTFWSV
jgi:hypothetical protein